VLSYNELHVTAVIATREILFAGCTDNSDDKQAVQLDPDSFACFHTDNLRNFLHYSPNARICSGRLFLDLAAESLLSN
jgi:hypothetical protein